VSVEPELDFEAALDELEQIVDNLEAGEPALAEALAKYERGIHLLARCQGLLDGADRTVALLAGVDASGQPLTTPFDTTATADRGRDQADSPTPKPTKPNDGIPF
jgi:exodeoxyribonuclease VII small subunit